MLNFMHTDVWRNFIPLNKSTQALINIFHGVAIHKFRGNKVCRYVAINTQGDPGFCVFLWNKHGAR